MFEKMDANGDGRVTAAEMTAAHQKITGKKPEKGEMTAVEKIKTMDTNGDSVLTVEEYAAGSQWMFQQMDTDHDGYLTKAEVKAGHQKFMPKKAAAPSSEAHARQTSGARAKRGCAATDFFRSQHRGLRNAYSRGTAAGRGLVVAVLRLRRRGTSPAWLGGVLRGVAHASLLFAVAHVPGGPRVYHAVTRGLLRSQRRVIRKLQRVWPGYARVWRERCGLDLEGRTIWVHEPGLGAVRAARVLPADRPRRRADVDGRAAVDRYVGGRCARSWKRSWTAIPRRRRTGARGSPVSPPAGSPALLRATGGELATGVDPSSLPLAGGLRRPLSLGRHARALPSRGAGRLPARVVPHPASRRRGVARLRSP